MWSSAVPRWDDIPEERLVSGELRPTLLEAIDALPRMQRAVITLRDIEGWPSGEVCEYLGVADGNQRVLLHRARAAARAAHRAVPRGRSGAMLTCADVVKLVTDYNEGRLTPAERRRFEEHISICPPCRSFLDQMRKTVERLGELREEDVPPAMEQHLLAAFRDWSRDE